MLSLDFFQMLQELIKLKMKLCFRLFALLTQNFI